MSIRYITLATIITSSLYAMDRLIPIPDLQKEVIYHVIENETSLKDAVRSIRNIRMVNNDFKQYFEGDAFNHYFSEAISKKCAGNRLFAYHYRNKAVIAAYLGTTAAVQWIDNNSKLSYSAVRDMDEIPNESYSVNAHQLLMFMKPDKNERKIDWTTPEVGYFETKWIAEGSMKSRLSTKITVIQLLRKCNLLDQDGALLVTAIGSHRYNLVEFFANKETVNFCDGYYTPIMAAIKQQDYWSYAPFDCLDILLKHKPNLEIKTDNGKTALSYLIAGYHPYFKDDQDEQRYATVLYQLLSAGAKFTNSDIELAKKNNFNRAIPLFNEFKANKL